MRILITAYNICNQNKAGGVKVRVKKIYELLSGRSDVEVDYFTPMTTDLSQYDVLHIFKLEPEFLNLVKCAKKLGVKVVLSSIVPLEGGGKIDWYRILINKIPLQTSQHMAFQVLQNCDAIIAETYQEKKFITLHYGINIDKIYVIGNGVEKSTYSGDDIYQYIGGKKDYVLQVGRVNSNKNYLNVIKALKGTGVDYVIIGDGDHGDRTYYDECVKVAEGDCHIHFLGWVDSGSTLLHSAYNNAKVMIVPSFKETFSLVALEGAIAGCNMAMTKTLPIHDFHVFDNCWLFDPYNVEDIRDKVIKAFNEPKTETTRRKIEETFSWSKIIDDHVKLYTSLIK